MEAIVLPKLEVNDITTEDYLKILVDIVSLITYEKASNKSILLHDLHGKEMPLLSLSIIYKNLISISDILSFHIQSTDINSKMLRTEIACNISSLRNAIKEDILYDVKLDKSGVIIVLPIDNIYKIRVLEYLEEK